MDGCLAVIYRVSAHYRIIHAKFSGPDSFADGLPLHISNILMPLTAHPRDHLVQERVLYIRSVLPVLAYTSFVVFLTTKPYRCGSFQKIKFTFSTCTNQCTKYTTTVIFYCTKLLVFIVIPTTKPCCYISLNNSLKHIIAIFYLA